MDCDIFQRDEIETQYSAKASLRAHHSAKASLRAHYSIIPIMSEADLNHIFE
jgi:hypothetical protein